MMKGIKICSWIKGIIFAYFPKMSAYPDSSYEEVAGNGNRKV